MFWQNGNHWKKEWVQFMRYGILCKGSYCIRWENGPPIVFKPIWRALCVNLMQWVAWFLMEDSTSLYISSHKARDRDYGKTWLSTKRLNKLCMSKVAEEIWCSLQNLWFPCGNDTWIEKVPVSLSEVDLKFYDNHWICLATSLKHSLLRKEAIAL